MTGRLEKKIEDSVLDQGVRIIAARQLAEMDYDDVEPTRGADIAEDGPPPEWFVDHYCPRRIFLLAGQEGIGKGLAAVWMATQMLKKRPHLGNVLVMSTEDDAEEIRRRFTAAGLSKKDFDNRVFFVEQRLSDKFLAEIVERHNISLIIADALRDYTMRAPGQRAGANNDDAMIRDALIRMREFAKAADVGIIGIHHTRKASRDANGKRSDTRERIAGAGAWQQVLRHVVFLDKAGKSPDHRFAIGVAKSNCHPTGFTQEYVIEPVGGLGVRFAPTGEINDDLDIFDWKESFDNNSGDELTADEEYAIVLEALRETRREDGTLLGAGPLWHEALKNHGQIKKATIPAVLARIRADGIITGKTVKIEFTDEVIAREEAELELEAERIKRGLPRKGRR